MRSSTPSDCSARRASAPPSAPGRLLPCSPRLPAGWRSSLRERRMLRRSAPRSPTTFATSTRWPITPPTRVVTAHSAPCRSRFCRPEAGGSSSSARAAATTPSGPLPAISRRSAARKSGEIQPAGDPVCSPRARRHGGFPYSENALIASGSGLACHYERTPAKRDAARILNRASEILRPPRFTACVHRERRVQDDDRLLGRDLREETYAVVDGSAEILRHSLPHVGEGLSHAEVDTRLPAGAVGHDGHVLARVVG